MFKLLPNHNIDQFHEIEGWLSAPEAQALYNIARTLGRNATVVEIGSWKGKSTYCIAKGLKRGHVYAIDPFNADGEDGSREEYHGKKGQSPLYLQFLKNMRDYEVLNKVIPLIGYSKDFTDFIDEIDFLFIDGDHSIEGCKFDFEEFGPKVKRGGIIAFHDYYPERKELGSTHVIEQIAIPSGDFRNIARHDSLWVGVKTV